MYRPKWIPIAKAASALDYPGVYEFAQDLVQKNFEGQDEPVRFAINGDTWKVRRIRGLRKHKLTEDRNLPKTFYTDNGEFSLCGFFNLWPNDCVNLASAHVNPAGRKCFRYELQLWTDQFGGESSADDIFQAVVDEQVVGFDELFVDAEDVGILAERNKTRLTEAMLRLIGVLAQAVGIDPRRPIDPVAKVLVEWCKAADYKVSKNTITSRLTEAFELVERVDFQKLPKIPN